jgi:hypothetical protein
LGQVDSGGIAVVEGLGVLEQWNDGISGLEESDLFLSDETSQILKLGHLSLFIPTIPPFHHSTIPSFHHSIVPISYSDETILCSFNIIAAFRETGIFAKKVRIYRFSFPTDCRYRP